MLSPAECPSAWKVPCTHARLPAVWEALEVRQGLRPLLHPPSQLSWALWVGHVPALHPHPWPTPPAGILGSTGSRRPVPRRGGAQVGEAAARSRWILQSLNGCSVLQPAAVICRWDSVSWKLLRLQVDAVRPGDRVSPSQAGAGGGGNNEAFPWGNGRSRQQPRALLAGRGAAGAAVPGLGRVQGRLGQAGAG